MMILFGAAAVAVLGRKKFAAKLGGKKAVA